MSARLLSSRCLSPDETRDLVVSLEHLGLETARIDVVAAPAISTDETSSVDRRAVARPARRVAIGLLAGIVVGLVLGVVAIVLTDALAAPTLLGFGIGGAAIGALTGLYARLPMNTTVADADTGQDSMVRVDVTGLDDETVANVEQLFAAD